MGEGLVVLLTAGDVSLKTGVVFSLFISLGLSDVGKISGVVALLTAGDVPLETGVVSSLFSVI